MSYFCHVTMVGRVGIVPEERKTSNNTAMATFRLAVTRWDGTERKEVTDWFSVVTFGTTAETALKFVAKGDLILIDGRLQTRSYTGQDGKMTTRTEVLAFNLRLFPRGRPVDDGQQLGAATQGSPPPAPVSWQAEASVPF